MHSHAIMCMYKCVFILWINFHDYSIIYENWIPGRFPAYTVYYYNFNLLLVIQGPVPVDVEQTRGT